MKRKECYFGIVMLFAIVLCSTVHLGASETSLLDANLAALRSDGSDGGPDGPGTGPEDPDNPIRRGYKTGIKLIPIPGEMDYMEVPCCVPSVSSDLCDYQQLGCIDNPAS